MLLLRCFKLLRNWNLRGLARIVVVPRCGTNVTRSYATWWSYDRTDHKLFAVSETGPVCTDWSYWKSLQHVRLPARIFRVIVWTVVHGRSIATPVRTNESVSEWWQVLRRIGSDILCVSGELDGEILSGELMFICTYVPVCMICVCPRSHRGLAVGLMPFGRDARIRVRVSTLDHDARSLCQG